MANSSIIYKQILNKKDYLPFYVYDFSSIKRQILRLKKELPKNVKLFYSVKANPNIAILKIMKNFDLNVEIVSLGELLAVKKASFYPSKVAFVGSTKTDTELLSSLKERIGLFSIESISEIKRLNKFAKNFSNKPKIIIRLNSGKVQGIKFSKYNKVGNFGLKLKEFEKVLYNFSKEFPNLRLEGIHFYTMHRIHDYNILTKGIINAFSIVKTLEKKFNIDFKIINIGGGFEANMQEELAIESYCKELKKLIKKYDFSNKEIILEIGRYLVNKAGTYVTKIIDSDKKKGEIFLTVECILNHLIRSLGKSIGEEDKDNFIIKILPQRKGRLYPTIIHGQVSLSVDTFGHSFDCKFLLPEPKIGDFITIKGVGAYGLTLALSLFGSHSIAAEFLMINNKLELIRNKGRHDDFLTHQCIPSILDKKY